MYKMLWMRNLGDGTGINFALEIENNSYPESYLQHFLILREAIELLDSPDATPNDAELDKAFHRHVGIICDVAVRKLSKPSGGVIRLTGYDFPPSRIQRP